MLTQAGISNSKTQLEIVSLITMFIKSDLALTLAEHGPERLVACMRTDWVLTYRESGPQDNVSSCLCAHNRLFVPCRGPYQL